MFQKLPFESLLCPLSPQTALQIELPLCAFPKHLLWHFLWEIILPKVNRVIEHLLSGRLWQMLWAMRRTKLLIWPGIWFRWQTEAQPLTKSYICQEWCSDGRNSFPRDKCACQHLCCPLPQKWAKQLVQGHLAKRGWAETHTELPVARVCMCDPVQSAECIHGFRHVKSNKSWMKKIKYRFLSSYSLNNTVSWLFHSINITIGIIYNLKYMQRLCKFTNYYVIWHKRLSTHTTWFGGKILESVLYW